MSESTLSIQKDFDRIALLSSDGWNHNSHYHDFLLRHVPEGARTALEVGCGTGAFSRLLAERVRNVTALDLSPQMIEVAARHAAHLANIDFRVADFMACDLPADEFDCIASIATLHHMPAGEALLKMKRALKAGGRLLVLDLFEPEGFKDALRSALLAMPLSGALNLIRRGRLRAPREVRAVWAEHARHDSFLTMNEVRRTCARFLPGAVVRKHLFWRYSLIWRKPVV